MFAQKQNQKISQIRSYSTSVNDVSNESRHKWQKMNIHQGKSKDELRREYAEIFKTILHLLRKILENVIREPLNKKYRILKCTNDKLKALVFCYSPCCEFLRLC